ncbi:MAG TPA: YdeI/OmpD-associated family protein [Opitutaceae bacterium]|nr:YdeI/OmpD-associated family protein [Opitutaceae bacterium]
MKRSRSLVRSGAIVLTARLYKVTQVRWVDIPRAKVARLGKSRTIDSLLRFNGDIDRVTLLPGKPGCYKLAFKVELLRPAGVEAGDVVSFTLEPDLESREPELPGEMARAFNVRPELGEKWSAHSVAIRRQIVRYILQAKSPEVQGKRCAIFVERLAETGSLTQVS